MTYTPKPGDTGGQPPAKRGGVTLSPRQILGLFIVVLLVIFFIQNWSDLTRELDLDLLIFFTVSMGIGWWMIILAAAGFVGGFLLGRSRYKQRRVKH